MGKNVFYKAKIIGTKNALEFVGVDDISGQDVDVFYEFNDNYVKCKDNTGHEWDVPQHLLMKY